MSNLTEDYEEEEDEFEFPLRVLIPYGMFIALCILFGILGNVLTILAFIRDKQLHTVYNTYLFNLAITDFFLSISSMMFYAVYTLKSYTWDFGYHFCKVYMVIDFTLCLESVLIIMIISVDRLLLLKFGPHYNVKITMKTAFVVIGVSWVVAFLLYGPAIIGWDIWTGENIVEELDCDVQFAYDMMFTTITACIEFGIPFSVIAVVNCIVLNEIRNRKQIGIARNQNKNKKNDRSKSDMKAVKFLAALVIVFLVTWLPYTVTTVIISFCEECVDENLYEFFNWLLWSKAALNPFLYAYNSARFKKNFADMLPFLARFLDNPTKNETTKTQDHSVSRTVETNA